MSAVYGTCVTSSEKPSWDVLNHPWITLRYGEFKYILMEVFGEFFTVTRSELTKQVCRVRIIN